jgi:hypothetical protein
VLHLSSEIHGFLTCKGVDVVRKSYTPYVPNCSCLGSILQQPPASDANEMMLQLLACQDVTE